MRQLTTTLQYFLRATRIRRPGKQIQENNVEELPRMKFTEEELTEMGQYRTKPKARNVTDIFREKIEQKNMGQYLRRQKQNIQDKQSDKNSFEEQQQISKAKAPKMEKKSKAVRREQLRTFRIYKHQDLMNRKQEEQAKRRMQKGADPQVERLQQLANIRLSELYLPYEYMRRVQKIFHKYDQKQLRNISFHFTNLMKLRYSQQKINYDLYPELQFQKLQQKLPFHRKVDQIYLTSKEKALQQKVQQQRKADENPIQSEIKYSQNIVVSYLLNRVPRTYAVAYRALMEIKKKYDGYTPKSFLDFGAGLSSGASAFCEVFGDTGYVYTVEPAGKMRKLGKFLTQYSKILHFQSLAQLSSQIKKVDVVYCGYVLNQIRPELVNVYLEALYAKVKNQGFLVLTEYGNPFGARLIHESRKWAIQKKMRIVAPCPHALKCPLSNSSHWCHFDQPTGMYPREVFGKMPFENSIKLQKYSYLILQKISQEQQVQEQIQRTELTPNVSDEWDRILFPLIRKGQHFIYTLCSKNGKFEKRITSKSHGSQYKLGKKLKWGDLWRFGFRIPNRYRKQRRTGKRLW